MSIVRSFQVAEKVPVWWSIQTIKWVEGLAFQNQLVLVFFWWLLIGIRVSSFVFVLDSKTVQVIFGKTTQLSEIIIFVIGS